MRIPLARVAVVLGAAAIFGIQQAPAARAQICEEFDFINVYDDENSDSYYTTGETRKHTGDPADYEELPPHNPTGDGWTDLAPHHGRFNETTWVNGWANQNNHPGCL